MNNASKFFLVLLRFAIGWHLLFEGLHKLDTYSTDDPWSARTYLENSEGPFGKYFRGLVDKEDPQVEFEKEVIAQRWRRHLEHFQQFYNLDMDQRESTEGEFRFAEKRLTKEIFEDPHVSRIYQQYARDITATPGSLTTSEQTRLAENRYLLRNHVARLANDYELQLIGLLTPEQRERGNSVVSAGKIGWVNRLVVWGLILCGGSLILGLFTRLAALAAAAMLLAFYLAMPPFPGLTAATQGLSHYSYVNNNLIEAITLLLLATTNSGHWAGLDALVRGLAPLSGARRARGSP